MDVQRGSRGSRLSVGASAARGLVRMSSARKSLACVVTQAVRASVEDIDEEDEELPEEEKWAKRGFTGCRLKAGVVLNGPIVKYFMIFVVCLNTVQVFYESDVAADCRWKNKQSACDQEDGWLLVMNRIYLVFYTIECLSRIFVFRWRILVDAGEIFDCLIVIAGICGEIWGNELPSPGILRIFRLARLVKILRSYPLPDEVGIMIHGFGSALFAICLGTVLVFLMIALWAVVAVALLNGPNHDDEIIAKYDTSGSRWGPKAWGSISNSIFTLTQLLIMGEYWSLYAIPLIEKYPAILLYFVAVFFTVVLGMTNLILAVIVDKALSSHNETLEHQAQLKERDRTKAVQKFIALCKSLDADDSGALSLQELISGYDNIDDFRHTLSVLEISKSDLALLFYMMDSDNSDDVSYEEFAHQLVRLHSENLSTSLNFVLHHVIETQVLCNKIFKQMDGPSEKSSISSASGIPSRVPSSVVHQKKRIDNSWKPTGSNYSSRVSTKSLSSLSPSPSPSPVQARVEPVRAEHVEQNTEPPPKARVKVSISDAVVPEDTSIESNVAQLRDQVHTRAVEACTLLEKQALAFAECEKCAASFVQALQASVDQQQAKALEVKKGSDGGLLGDRARKDRDVLEWQQQKDVMSREFSQELKEVETRLMTEFARLSGQLRSDHGVRQAERPDRKYWCLPDLKPTMDSDCVTPSLSSPPPPRRV